MLFTLRLLPYTKVVARRIIYVAFFLNFAITLIACVCMLKPTLEATRAPRLRSV